MNRLAALLGVLLHLFGALIAPGLHLHEHVGGGESGSETNAHAPCCSAHEEPSAPEHRERDRFSTPGHDERDCAICALAFRALDTPPEAVLLPVATIWALGAPAVSEALGREGVRAFVPTRGPPEQAS